MRQRDLIGGHGQRTPAACAVASVGLSAALDTFCGQAFGAKEKASVGVHTQRAMLVLFAICIPVSVVWNCTEPILIFIRQNREVSAVAGSYIRWMIPALFGYALVQCQTRFLNNQGVVLPLMLSSLLCSVLNVPLCWLLVLKSPLANKGAAMALSISYWFNAILLALYIKYSPTCKETWTGFSRDAFHHVPQFLKLAVSSALMICLRFWALELLVLLSGILPDPKLETSAFSITRNTSSIVTMISVGLSTSASIRVSNELGAGRPKQARKVVLIALFIATSEGLSVSLLLVLLRNVWGKVYSNETKVVKYVANMLPLVAISHLFDSTQCLFAGTLRGCGLQKIGAIVMIGTLYIIGIPLSVVLGFPVHLRSKGFWIGFIIALFVQDLIFGMLFSCISWENLIRLSSALDTFCGQAFGAKEEASVGVHTQRAMLVLITICVPVSVMWNFTEPILIFIRQNRDVSTEAASYIRWLIPGLFGYALVQCQTRFLNNQRVVVPLMLSSLICSVLNVPLCWLLVFKSPFANKGAAMALSISYWFNAILLALYIRFSHTCKATWKGFSRDALHHVPQFLKLAASSALMLCLRFWSLELLVLLSGILPDPKLETSAFLITRNTSSIVTMIAIGLSTSVSIRVSNELGAGRPKEARKVILIAFFIATSEGLSISLLLVLLRNIWGKLYSNETKVVKYVANILPLVAICHIVDTTQCLFSGTLRGCVLQKKGAVIILGTTYIIGVPLSVVLGFVVHLRAKGFWIGFIIALCVQDLIFGMLLLGIDWEILAAKAKERVHISISQKENVYNREGQTDIGQLKGIRSTVTEEDHVCPPHMP